MPRFRSMPLSEHPEVPLADDARLEELVADFDARSESSRLLSPTGARDLYVVSVACDRDPRIRGAQLAEIVSLVENQGDRVVGAESLHVTRLDPRTLLGTGSALDVAARARAAGATMLVLDAELSPSQARNLEDAVHLAVCDREAVILNVLRARARTRRAKIQVELAQLDYLRPRIRGVGLDMDQQTGGMARARGPGETASELLARKLDGRVAELRKALGRLETSSDVQRRLRSDCTRLTLVGYTNAGKTSLMNALTGVALPVRDRPFETLDTTSRSLSRHGGDVVMSDTVGFIRRMPERLLESFASTLAEARDASLLVIVADASDVECELHLRTTHELLERIGAGRVPRYFVFNKVDRLEQILEPSVWEARSNGHPWSALSVHDPRSVARLRDELLRLARRGRKRRSLRVLYDDAPRLDRIYAHCRVLASRAEENGLVLEVEGPAEVVDMLDLASGEVK